MDPALLYQTSMDWSPSFPRRSTFGEGANQTAVGSRTELVEKLTDAAESGGPGYYSVYSFPRGHSQDNEVPEIDTLFIDFDIPPDEGDYDPSGGGTTEEWKRDMSRLLVRARMVASAIEELGLEEYFRVSYSGHKGIHLYIDFEPIDPNLGPLQKYKNGLQSYADEVIEHLSDEAGVEISRWVDVTSHDLGRLARHPNTPHHGAHHVDWTPYCVPGSIGELASMTPERYLEATKKPREPIGSGRTESERAYEALTEHIKQAAESKSSGRSGVGAARNEEVLEVYREESNEKITLEAVENFLVSNKPCIMEWRNRDDAYKHGAASREMEINVIKELAKHEVPIDVMVEFFRPIPRFDEDFTRSLVKDVISRYHPSAFVCRNVVNHAPQFCLGDSCHIYSRADDLELPDGMA